MAEFVPRCMLCQQVKGRVIEARWAIISIGGPRNGRGKSVTKDFVDGLPRSRKGNTSIWVIVDRLTKSAHFIPVMSKRTASGLASIYLR